MARRQLLVAGGGAFAWVGAGRFLRAHAQEASGPRFDVDAAASGVVQRRMHGGQGVIDVKFFFEPGRPMAPALFLQYDIPPGGSEGVHTHDRGHANGPWDEFYYIVRGRGQMHIDGQPVAVKAGDNIHTPLGVPHGIENTDAALPLSVYLVAIDRG